MSEMRRVRVPAKGSADRQRDPVPPAEEPGASCDCPRLEREEWDEVESDWGDIVFLKTGVTSLMGLPVGYATSRGALIRKAEELGYTVPDDAMLLFGEGRFRRELLLEVEGAADGSRGLVRPGGFAFTRLVAAPWGELKRAVRETEEAARSRYGRPPDETWVWYLTCRECSTERNFETLVVAHYRERP